jgi:hypothetical protein
MARRGRPRSDRAASAKIVYVKLRLYPDEDGNLIRFFASIPSGLRATMVKQALQSGSEIACQDDAPEDDDVFSALDSLVG